MYVYAQYFRIHNTAHVKINFTFECVLYGIRIDVQLHTQMKSKFNTSAICSSIQTSYSLSSMFGPQSQLDQAKHKYISVVCYHENISFCICFFYSIFLSCIFFILTLFPKKRHMILSRIYYVYSKRN